MKRCLSSMTLFFAFLTGLAPAQVGRWWYSHDGPSHSDDERLRSVAVAPGGLSFSAGCDSVAGHDNRFLVVGLDTAGNERWLDAVPWGEAEGICLGADGHVYACGVIRDSAGRDAFAVVSWTQAGTRRWTYLNAGDSSGGQAHALCPRPGSGVYACGWTEYAQSWVQFTVVALDSAGTVVWLDTCGGTGMTYDEAMAITTDESGAAYAVGTMYDVAGEPAHCAVRKLSPAGHHEWTRSWEPVSSWGSEFICVAVARGLVYAGGASGVTNIDTDIILAALDTAGTERWFYRYDGAGGGVNLDWLEDIVIDSRDNIYCGGYAAQEDDHLSACVLSMRPDSTPRWEYWDTPTHPAANNMVRALCLSPEGHVFAAGDRNSILAIFTVWCLDTLGNLVWAYEKQPYQSDNPWDIAADTAGNTVVVGSMVLNGSRDCYAMSFRPVPVNRGVTVGGSGSDIGQAICRTMDGGYAVVGYTNSFGAGGQDVYLVRFNSSAETVWTRTYGTTRDQYGWALFQRMGGGFVVAGFTSELGTRRWDLLLLATDAAGNQEWYRTYGLDSMTHAAYGIARLKGDSLLVAGTRGPYGQNSQNDLYVLRCEPDGDSVWSRTYGTDQYDLALSVSALADDGFILAGSMGNVEDLALLRADAGGTELWRKTYGYSGQDRADAVAGLDNGGFAVAGYTIRPGLTADCWLLVTDEDGDTLRTSTAGGSGDDRATGIVAIPGSGYGMCGTTTSWGAGGTDIVVFGFDSLGSQSSRALFGGVAADAANDVCYATGGGYAVCGSTGSFGSGGNDLYLVIVGGPVAVTETRPEPLPPSRRRGPTIVRGTLRLTDGSSTSSGPSLLLDATGRTVMELRAGANDVSRLAPGVYFVREYSAFSTQHSALSAVRKVVVTR